MECNNHLYGIRKTDMDDTKVSGLILIGLIDIPIEEQGIRSVLANPQYRINLYCMKYNDMEDAKKFLEGRQKKNGGTKKIVEDRIERATYHQNEIKSYRTSSRMSSLSRNGRKAPLSVLMGSWPTLLSK